jgi:hypothetical protein
MLAFCDNRCWIGDKSSRQAAQPECLSQMCPEGHRNAYAIAAGIIESRVQVTIL